MSEAVTNGVRVQVESRYLEEHSDPASKRWVHVYRVTIINEGDEAVQLVSRHWIITNSRGEEEHVRGPGVVGETPTMEPGEGFQYTSGCPLDTAFGTMHGTYQMVTRGGTHFNTKITPFTLAEPYALN